MKHIRTTYLMSPAEPQLKYFWNLKLSDGYKFLHKDDLDLKVFLITFWIFFYFLSTPIWFCWTALFNFAIYGLDSSNYKLF